MSEGSGRPGVRVCGGCGDRLRPDARPDAVFCSTACRARSWRRDRRLRRRVMAELNGAGRVTCPQCGTPWVAGVDRRSDAVYCSRRCVMRAGRSRNESFGEQSQ
ncbi:hypothetical protein E6U81_34325 [Streptomyces sp. A0592]|nr:hypothetical protein E6U81_34325 [Streptomyces sp. A0592]